MPVGYKRTTTTGAIEVWQRDKAMQNAQGGFALDRTGYADNAVIKAGTPMIFDESTRLAKPITTAVMYANANSTATAYPVKKGHNFKIGDNFAAKSGSKAYPITGIDTTTSADFDTITVTTTIGALNAGDLTFASTATGATASSYGSIKGLLYCDAIVPESPAVESVDVTIRGTIYARRVPYSADLDAALKAAGAYIIYSQSY